VPYWHVVFTLPHELAPLALQNQRLLYGLLFEAASRALIELAQDPKHLGAGVGFLAILHTWGQTLLHHPHLHCLVPAGGLATQRDRWISARPGFFLPVRALSRLFRGKYLALLQRAYDQRRVEFHGSLDAFADAQSFARWLRSVREREWVVYVKPPFGGPEHVLKYLARYTHRVAISNRRLRDLHDGDVTFEWKDYAHEHATRLMTLRVGEFTRRFLLHVLPDRFVRIRSYGFLANCQRDARLALCRRLLESAAQSDAPPATHEPSAQEETAPGEATRRCPACRTGHLITVELLQPDTS
jgi:hypothetical protein